MLVNSDFKELLSILNGKGVKYLVIGGYAVIKYAEPRYTKDLDLRVWAEPQYEIRVPLKIDFRQSPANFR